jgi:hypothetical protein
MMAENKARANPVWLETEAHDELLTFRVLAEAAANVAGNFVLEVSSGSNHSVHRASVKAVPGTRSVLSTVSVVSGAQWRANLTVQLVGEEPYEQGCSSET